MAIRRFILLFSFSFFTYSALAQKVKYKDIYLWLSNKQYNEAEPFLKRYVKENDDNPNAFLYMGLVFENASMRHDLLKQTSILLGSLDSALIFLNKGYATITEKELKRNDEYYETFKRRDLRTGEYGVKLSDIQFFIEKKQQELHERIDKIKLAKQYFTTTDSLYKNSQAQYIALADKFITNQSLLLQADQPDVEQLEKLSGTFKAFEKTYDLYKTNLQTLGKTGYSPELELLSVKDISKDGKSITDFHDNKLSVWDYKQFAESNLKLIKDDIIPLRDLLVSTDIDINKLREKLEKDSVTVREDVEKLRAKIPYEHLFKYDSKPLVKNIFDIRLADLNYRSSLISHKPLRDSADVRLKYQIATEEKKLICALDSIASLTPLTFIDERAKDYAHYIKSTYNNAGILKSYVRGIQEFASREKTAKVAAWINAGKVLNWLVVGPDSIPLIINPGLAYANQPLAIEPEKYTAGLHYKDTATVTGYFHSITPSRKPDVSASFPLEKGLYSLSRLTRAKALVASDPAGQIFIAVVYSEGKLKDKYSMTVAKIYRSDGLAWSHSYEVDQIPASCTFVNGEVTISSSEGLNYLIDKNGKMK
jgi:hypothetical protein